MRTDSSPSSNKIGHNKSRPNAAATAAPSGNRGSIRLAPRATARCPTNIYPAARNTSESFGYRTGTIEALEGLAAVARERGESEQAQQHLRRAEELRDEIASS